VVLDSSGKLVSYDKLGQLTADTGTWRCVKRLPVTIEITWSNGYRDTLGLEASGRRLEGKNQYNNRVWGERIR
jgi:hypothetical protein